MFENIITRARNVVGNWIGTFITDHSKFSSVSVSKDHISSPLRVSSIKRVKRKHQLMDTTMQCKKENTLRTTNNYLKNNPRTQSYSTKPKRKKNKQYSTPPSTPKVSQKKTSYSNMKTRSGTKRSTPPTCYESKRRKIQVVVPEWQQLSARKCISKSTSRKGTFKMPKNYINDHDSTNVEYICNYFNYNADENDACFLQQFHNSHEPSSSYKTLESYYLGYLEQQVSMMEHLLYGLCSKHNDKVVLTERRKSLRKSSLHSISVDSCIERLDYNQLSLEEIQILLPEKKTIRKFDFKCNSSKFLISKLKCPTEFKRKIYQHWSTKRSKMGPMLRGYQLNSVLENWSLMPPKEMSLVLSNGQNKAYFV